MIERLSNDAAAAGATHVSAASETPFRLDDYAGLATYRGKPIYTLDQVVHQIDSGTALSGGNNTFTYGFLDGPHTVGVYNNPNDGFSEPAGYIPFSEAQKAAARQAIQYWDDLIPQHFVEKTGNGVDILYANTTTGPAQAWTYYPGAGVKVQGDVWAATPAANWTNNWLNFNGYGLTTLVHETGHALGLSHPGDYNYGADTDGDGTPTRSPTWGAPSTPRTRCSSRSCPTSIRARPARRRSTRGPACSPSRRPRCCTTSM